MVAEEWVVGVFVAEGREDMRTELVREFQQIRPSSLTAWRS